MYSTIDLRLTCDGAAAEALPRFQAVVDDLAAMLRERHPGIEVQEADEPLTPDDVREGLEEADLVE